MMVGRLYSLLFYSVFRDFVSAKKPEEKLEILKNEFEIKVTEKIEEDISEMCNINAEIRCYKNSRRMSSTPARLSWPSQIKNEKALRQAFFS